MERSNKLRELGLTPTIQRMAVLDCLESTNRHPTADEILVSVRKTFPTVSRATVYNTLEVLSKAGLVLKITVDPAVARYDADTGPHAHFRCRICSIVYDVMMDEHVDLDDYIEGHHVESVRTYAYGVCTTCLQKDPSLRRSVESPNKRTKIAGEKASKAASLGAPPPQQGGDSPDA